MKTKFSVLFIFFTVLFSASEIRAQDIEGFVIGERLTKEQVLQKFGEPADYTIVQAYDDDDIYHQTFIYDISTINNKDKGLKIEIIDNLLISFVISSPKYCSFTKYTHGGIKVGDAFTNMNDFFIPDKIENRDEGTLYMKSGYNDTDNKIYILVDGDKIVRIVASCPFYD